MHLVNVIFCLFAKRTAGSCTVTPFANFPDISARTGGYRCITKTAGADIPARAPADCTPDPAVTAGLLLTGAMPLPKMSKNPNMPHTSVISM